MSLIVLNSHFSMNLDSTVLVMSLVFCLCNLDYLFREQLEVLGMTCSACTGAVEKALMRAPGRFAMVV